MTDFVNDYIILEYSIFFIFLDLKQMVTVCSLGNSLYFTFWIGMCGDTKGMLIIWEY